MLSDPTVPSSQDKESRHVEDILTTIFPAAVQFLRDLVEMNSFTGNIQGVRDNADRIIRQFAPLQFTPRFVQCAMPDTGEHLFLESDGDGPTILLVSHLDTVFPLAEQGAAFAGWKDEGKTTYGPGIFDIKGGTVMIWMILRAVSEMHPELFTRVRWVVACNAAEERLNRHFAEVCQKLVDAREAYCLVFEGDNRSAEGFEILSHRNGLAHYHVSVRGRSAHSGGNGSKNGINAITQLSSVITRISALTDHDRNITVNVGIVRGGVTTNRVPDLAEAWLEVRFPDLEQHLRLKNFLLGLNGRGDLAAVSDGVQSEITVEMEGEVDPWLPCEGGLRMAEIWTEAGLKCGHPVSVSRRGGLSDANFLARHFPTLDGLGPRGANAHGLERTQTSLRITEFVDLESFVPKALINTMGLLGLLTANLE